MKHLLAAFLLMAGAALTLPGVGLAAPDLPEPPRPGDLPRPPDPPGPAPRPPAPGELPDVDDDHPWWDPLGVFDDDDDDGHDRHGGKKQKHREKHDD